ncbi:MAG: AAA family ATPase [Microcoleus sp. PH2017_29_MFU_D_A]|uniref:NB-ARC domain-containing protein n=1 Tax=unclassified Microcoleus TaxID=2642155 RepID=UPI001DDF63F7|nr:MULTISPECIES: NB-ARC domain-containing protein [unclassified Microcoleus]TAF88439.1 MAG: AAA family ATPase [Oscillatoriales cyanobacterium]MCC3413374.1 AAA family ATPase [Microcoleus sp. PH2017_02_FOX_O_A]MCC3438347.1 AAA family ATPase [Microcoleus sp. PH2017_05_CCC_O_A]MCC3446090.1 AAA family ATPase [Microcoleus sp. PH2017_09_SFU_O_A]MCC3475863.1 AAA family ATPase [Microcoleus sp. PH2017_13_LAR_U_A]
MNVTEVLQCADQLVFTKTGKYLDDVQKAVITGVYQGKTYDEIADDCKRSESRVRNVGRQLWQILSKQLGEDVNKHNFRSTFQRLHIQSSQNQKICHVNGSNHNFNFNPQILYNTNKDNQENITKNQSKSLYHDLTLAPKITSFYDRTTELQTLSHWLTHQNTRLISVLGLSGIGKTTLVKQFVDLNLQQFDVVVWKNLKLSQSLDGIITEILTGVNHDSVQPDNKLTQLFNVLRQKKCLIILDDIQELFIKGDWAGQFKTEYKNYQNLFTMMTEIEHQSSLILISQEQCQEMICLDEELYPIKCLELEGVESRSIMKNWGLKDDETWAQLIKLYEGNPVYLKDIVSLIKNIFGGKVADFLNEDSLIVTKDMKSRLTKLFKRLSPREQEIVLQLSKFEQPVSREDLRQSLSLSSMDLMNGLESLRQRYLVKRIEGEQVLFDLSLVVREYVRTCCQN